MAAVPDGDTIYFDAPSGRRGVTYTPLLTEDCVRDGRHVVLVVGTQNSQIPVNLVIDNQPPKLIVIRGRNGELDRLQVLEDVFESLRRVSTHASTMLNEFTDLCCRTRNIGRASRYVSWIFG